MLDEKKCLKSDPICQNLYCFRRGNDILLSVVLPIGASPSTHRYHLFLSMSFGVKAHLLRMLCFVLKENMLNPSAIL